MVVTSCRRLDRNWTRSVACASVKWALSACVVGALLIPSAARGQPRERMLNVWDTDRGLPSSSVTSLAQTPEGYLWAGTQNGLLRFDGLRFATFDPETTPELLHARVEHLFVDPQGTLWINTYDGSITSWRAGVFRHEWKGAGSLRFEAFLAPSQEHETVFVLDTGSVIRRPLPSTDAQWEILRPDKGTDLVPLFARDASGSLWVRSTDHRVWRVRDGTLEEVPTRGLVGGTVNCLVADRSGRIWVGTDAEIAVFEDGRFRTMTPTNGPARVDVTLLLFTRDGGYWVVANGRARKARDREWVWTRDAGEGLTGLFRQTVNALEDRRGGIWFSHYGKGLLHIGADGEARWITVADGLPGNRIRHVLEDREGNIWLAVDRAGLVRLRDARFQTFSTAQGSRTPAAASVAEDSRGAIWIGSIGAGLQRFAAGTLETVALPPTSAGRFVFSVFPTADGRLWMSADREDLFYFDGTRVRAAPWNLHGIKTILVDQSGAIWLGTKTGLSRALHGNLKTFGAADGFNRGDVRALAQDREGAIWIGLGDGTVFRYAHERFKEFRPHDGEHGHAVWSLYADTDGTIWIGTFRGGLLRLRDGQFTRYTTAHGLPSNIICQVLDDGAGQLWMGSYRRHLPRREGGPDVECQRRHPARELRPIRWSPDARMLGQLPTVGMEGQERPAVVRYRQGRRIGRSHRTSGRLSASYRRRRRSEVRSTGADRRRISLAVSPWSTPVRVPVHGTEPVEAGTGAFPLPARRTRARVGRRWAAALSSLQLSATGRVSVCRECHAWRRPMECACRSAARSPCSPTTPRRGRFSSPSGSVPSASSLARRGT